jgi:hypothetical protein
VRRGGERGERLVQRAGTEDRRLDWHCSQPAPLPRSAASAMASTILV